MAIYFFARSRSSNILTKILKDDQGLVKVLIIDLAQRFCWIVEGCGRSLLRSLQDLSSQIFFKIFESLLRDLGEVQIIIMGALLSSPVFNDQRQKWGKEHRPFSFEQASYQGLEYFKLLLIV